MATVKDMQKVLLDEMQDNISALDDILGEVAELQEQLETMSQTLRDLDASINSIVYDIEGAIEEWTIVLNQQGLPFGEPDNTPNTE